MRRIISLSGHAGTTVAPIDALGGESANPRSSLLILAAIIWFYSPEHARKELDAISI
jgi:hypothetical protein